MNEFLVIQIYSKDNLMKFSRDFFILLNLLCFLFYYWMSVSPMLVKMQSYWHLHLDVLSYNWELFVQLSVELRSI
jgi:hypothetical protein